MRRILSAAEMQQADKNTIERHHIPAAVLMERAAAACVFEIEENVKKTAKIGVLCGPGNNGGDGVAIARLLHLDGYDAKVLLLGNKEKYSDDLMQQLKAAESYEVRFAKKCSDLDDCDFLIDAIFGVGLGRKVAGEFADAINYVNQQKEKKNASVLSVDIPSGISSDTGQILGTAVKADTTVTFAYKKKGHCQGDGYLCSGRVFVADVGIYLDKADDATCSSDVTDEVKLCRTDAIDYDNTCFELEDTDISLIPRRSEAANKGSAKVLVIAGSSEIYGACYLSAKAAYRAGAGYVKVYTHKNNLPILKENLPEAVCIGYGQLGKPDERELKSLISWSDAVLIGPGISRDDNAKELLSLTLEHCDKPLIIDADAINILADSMQNSDRKAFCPISDKAPIIITPHLLEMSRLTGMDTSSIQSNMEDIAARFSREHDCTVLLKSFTSVIFGADKVIFFNTSGSEALATAGSGDVLSGMTAAFCAMDMDLTLAAAMAAYVHGRAGVIAAKSKPNGVILASEIIDSI